MRTYVIAFVFSLAFSCLGQDGNQVRVKVELSSPVSYKASVTEVKPAKPDAFEVKDVEPAKESDPVKFKSVASFAAELAKMEFSNVKDCSPVELAETQTEWYEKFHAKRGSKVWWILRVAKVRAELGEDVSSLKKAFDETMNKWLLED